MATRKKSTRKRSRKPKSRFTQVRPMVWLLRLTTLGIVLSIPFLIWLDGQVAERYRSHEWTIPAKVYARPLELFVGSTTSQQQLQDELGILGYHAGNGTSPGSFQAGQNRLKLHTRGFQFGDGQEPATAIEVKWQHNTVSSIQSSASNSDLFRLEPVQIGGIYPGHNEDRLLITLDDIPDGMIECLLAVEDRSYFDHFGVSLRGIARAMWVNLSAGQFTQGGSTLTQQLIKNLFLTNDRTLSRKLMEAPMALLLERHASKEDILQTFFNEVFLAQDGGRAIHGFGLASQFFFNQPLGELLPHQYALLVGMIKGPSFYNPVRNPARATERRNLVLDIMASQAIMSQDEADYAKTLPLGLNAKPTRSQRQPAYLDLVRRQLSEDYRLEDLQTDGLRIFTNFDPLVQTAAERAMKQAFADINKRPARQQKDPVELQGAMLVSDSSTGDILAVLGGREPRFAGFNRALDARRPVGSLIKPAIYLAALEQPDRFTLATRIEDERFELPQPDGSIWSPNNFDEISHGQVTLIEALSRSYNQASAQLGMQLGVDTVKATLEQLGLTAELPELPSMFLGAVELSLTDIAAMYQTLASGGFSTPLRSIREVLDANGEPIKHYSIDIEQRIAPDTLHLIHYAMQETMRNGTGRSAYQFMPESIAAAGKTGTSNGQRDSWFAGFTGDYLAVAWLGNDDYEKTSLTGSSGALRAWSYLMRDVSREPLEFIRPGGVEYRWIDEETGTLSHPDCEGAAYIPYIAGTEPLVKTACARAAGKAQTRRLPSWLRRIRSMMERQR